MFKSAIHNLLNFPALQHLLRLIHKLATVMRLMLAHVIPFANNSTRLSAERKKVHFNHLTPTVAIWMGRASCARPGYAIMCNLWHPGTLTHRAERQSAQISKITNDGLTRSCTWCFIAEPAWHQWASRYYKREQIDRLLYSTDSTSACRADVADSSRATNRQGTSALTNKSLTMCISHDLQFSLDTTQKQKQRDD